MTQQIEQISPDQLEEISPDQHLVSANVGSKITGFQATTLRKMAYLRRIRAFKVGGALRFRVSDLRSLIVERPAAPSGRGPRGGVSNPVSVDPDSDPW